MAHLFEFFGYRATDRSPEAIHSAEHRDCPFQHQGCTKVIDGTPTGACTLKMIRSDRPVIICPIRLYADDHQILQHVSNKAFGPGLELVPGAQAAAAAIERRDSVVAVFGKGWGGELRLPQRSGGGSYFVDWILALLNPDGSLAEFVAVEVQTIDTIGNYLASRTAMLEPDRTKVESKSGLNWENVSKRIIPQLIYKGQLLQREEACKKGLFFVCPSPVYDRIMMRLGGKEGLTTVPLQPHAITFMGYDHVAPDERVDGEPVKLKQEVEHTTSVSKLQERFGNVDLPAANVYRNAIQAALSGSNARRR
ncbi:NotI family restriction endonuclease [Paenarthrobacter sp. AB444]|uniref:NotI family restriction endonuclease n=1 Tax=Paenarthrobacter sp. AB444 TaxID=3025681 RepID=UPI0023673AC4|nr:NotI family restriction endonuclease [Paenarthrobacter sp. AB444]MDD7836423.1 NotI family restriction endonuclease [Paenarthrobacter sp. AB444]